MSMFTPPTGQIKVIIVIDKTDDVILYNFSCGFNLMQAKKITKSCCGYGL